MYNIVLFFIYMEYKSEMQGFYCPESIPMQWGKGRAGYVLDFLVLKRYKSRNFEKISVVVLYPILIHTLGISRGQEHLFLSVF